jgi:hypothetical protein
MVDSVSVVPWSLFELSVAILDKELRLLRPGATAALFAAVPSFAGSGTAANSAAVAPSFRAPA